MILILPASVETDLDEQICSTTTQYDCEVSAYLGADLGDNELEVRNWDLLLFLCIDASQLELQAMVRLCQEYVDMSRCVARKNFDGDTNVIIAQQAHGAIDKPTERSVCARTLAGKVCSDNVTQFLGTCAQGNAKKDDGSHDCQ